MDISCRLRERALEEVQKYTQSGIRDFNRDWDGEMGGRWSKRASWRAWKYCPWLCKL